MATYKIIDANMLRKVFCDMLTDLHDDAAPEEYMQAIGMKKYMDRLIQIIEEGDITK